MVFGGGAFETWLGHEGKVLMKGISALIKETPESSLAPSAMWGHDEKAAIYLSPDTKPANTLLLGLPASRTVKNEFLLLISYSVYGIFVIAAWRNKDVDVQE